MFDVVKDWFVIFLVLNLMDLLLFSFDKIWIKNCIEKIVKRLIIGFEINRKEKLKID